MKLSAASIIGLATSSSAFIATSNRLNQPYDTKLFERKPFITGNWKLNPKTKNEAIELATEIASTITPESPDVALFVPFPFIECVQKAVGDKLEVGAEVKSNGLFDMFWRCWSSLNISRLLIYVTFIDVHS